MSPEIFVRLVIVILLTAVAVAVLAAYVVTGFALAWVFSYFDVHAPWVCFLNGGLAPSAYG